jgi:hypothetical protein
MYLADRVKDTSTTTGTGTITVSGTAASTFVAFGTAYAVGDVVPYVIAHQSANEWEVGNGVLLTSTTISRAASDVQYGSAGAGVLVTFSAGTKDVFANLSADAAATVSSALAFDIMGNY